MFGQNIPFSQQILIYALYVWSLIWKGLALWRAAKHGQRNWFIVIIVVNSLGILDMIYLFRFCKKRMTWKEIQTWFQTTFLTKEKTS